VSTSRLYVACCVACHAIVCHVDCLKQQHGAGVLDRNTHAVIFRPSRCMLRRTASVEKLVFILSLGIRCLFLLPDLVGSPVCCRAIPFLLLLRTTGSYILYCKTWFCTVCLHYSRYSHFRRPDAAENKPVAAENKLFSAATGLFSAASGRQKNLAENKA
jgi:hypothetical protein